MDMLVLVTVEACSGVNKDSGNVLLLLAKAKHAVDSTVSAVFAGAHYGGGGLMFAASAHASLAGSHGLGWEGDEKR